MAASRIAEAQECNRGEETQSFDGPIPRAGRVQTKQGLLYLYCARWEGNTMQSRCGSAFALK